MADRYVREVGRVEDMEGSTLGVGVNYDTVTLSGYCFTRAQIEDVAHLIVAASWEAGGNAERMREESDGDGGPT